MQGSKLPKQYKTVVVCEDGNPYEDGKSRDYFKEIIEIMYIMFIKL